MVKILLFPRSIILNDRYYSQYRKFQGYLRTEIDLQVFYNLQIKKIGPGKHEYSTSKRNSIYSCK